MKNTLIATIVGIAIIAGVIGFQMYDNSYKMSTPEEYKKSVGTQSVAHVVYPDNPQFLGPLQINKDKYFLGENIYVILKDLQPRDKGAVLFLTPGGVLYEDWTFDGSKKDFMKKYFKPGLQKGKNLCEREDIVGEWTVMFADSRGEVFDMATLHFTMLDETLPGHELHFEGCEVAYQIDIREPITP
tara:strand:- start:261 stop:818 length:558 start_codon:yes stop_codon:yes gene_type:complete